jgi:predicted KAP-like P-loop ATPase
MKQNNNQLLADPPITTKAEDKLGRAPLAAKVASMLNKFEGNDSFVVGIEGEWGSGKTSFIELILESIFNGSDNKWKVVKFNPWVFFNTEALYLDFFAELGKITGSKDILNYGKKILRKVEVEPQLTIPFLGNLSVGKFKFGDSLRTLRDEIEKQLKDNGKKIIIVIDDIDRLDKEEAREVFKMVKVNANFPNIIYLLAYDRVRVEDILTKDNFPGKEYLKKIVQVSFALPKPEPNQIYEVLGEKLDGLLDSKELKVTMGNFWDKKRWGNLFVGGFRDVFKTIRDVKRFVSSWLLDYLVVGYNEVNPIDFLGVELIRVFAPDVYSEISGAKELFTKLDSGYTGVRDNRQQRLMI